LELEFLDLISTPSGRRRLPTRRRRKDRKMRRRKRRT